MSDSVEAQTPPTAAKSDATAREDFAPSSLADLVEIVRATPRFLPVGNGTKPRLSAIDCPKVSTTKLSGITEYDPSEYTFTALAGTPLSVINQALRERGQYLPFDPPLAASGATLGGSVAAGLSGPRRFRFGGIRDFILGVKFIDGSGTLLRLGGKVVKNAAGFDLPKFFVGSLGRFGVLVELTFKVFPKPRDCLTLRLEVRDHEAAARILIEAAKSRWEPYAIDYLPDRQEILLELGGPGAAIATLGAEILGKWPGKKLANEEAEGLWSELKEFRWAHQNGELIKVPLTPNIVAPFCNSLHAANPPARTWISAGGNAAFVSLPGGEERNTVKGAHQTEALARTFSSLGLTGLTLRGSGPLWLGKRSDSNIEVEIKRALDPVGRFPLINSKDE